MQRLTRRVSVKKMTNHERRFVSGLLWIAVGLFMPSTECTSTLRLISACFSHVVVVAVRWRNYSLTARYTSALVTRNWLNSLAGVSDVIHCRPRRGHSTQLVRCDWIRRRGRAVSQISKQIYLFIYLFSYLTFANSDNKNIVRTSDMYFRPALCFIFVYNCCLTVRSKRICYVTIRYDTRWYFNVLSKADISQLNLPHGTDN